MTWDTSTQPFPNIHISAMYEHADGSLVDPDDLVEWDIRDDEEPDTDDDIQDDADEF